MMFCPNGHSLTTEDAVFCPDCGEWMRRDIEWPVTAAGFASRVAAFAVDMIVILPLVYMLMFTFGARPTYDLRQMIEQGCRDSRLGGNWPLRMRLTIVSPENCAPGSPTGSTP